jgi:PilZ domain
MNKDKRNSRRRPMRYSAWLALGPNEMCVCTVSDISETGARIDVEGAKEFPDHFMLFLSHNGSARRACRVMWRTPRQLGVRFESHLAAAEHIAMEPKSDDKSAPVVSKSADPASSKVETAESTNAG